MVFPASMLKARCVQCCLIHCATPVLSSVTPEGRHGMGAFTYEKYILRIGAIPLARNLLDDVVVK